jgi:hypothetical protein
VPKGLGEVYRSVLKWTVDFNEVELASELQTLISLAASFSSTLIVQFESIPIRLREAIAQAIAELDRGKIGTIDVQVEFDTPAFPAFMAEFERVKPIIARLGIGDP